MVPVAWPNGGRKRRVSAAHLRIARSD